MMKRIVTLIAFLLMLPAFANACGVSEMTREGYENAPVEHAWQHWSQGASSPIPFVFIDVRTAGEFTEGHVPGARLLPLAELEQRLAEVPKDKRVYLYCRSGHRSAQAAALLTSHGYTNIENVLGGYTAWQQKGYEVTK
jgi:hydroxyacylglutathione hydrolase